MPDIKIIHQDSRSSFKIEFIIEGSLKDYAQRKAFEGMDKLRKTAKLRMSDKEFIAAKNKGRK